MVANLIQFATNHYLLVAIFVVLLAALLVFASKWLPSPQPAPAAA